MRVNSINSSLAAKPAFKAKIIDGHAHLGRWDKNNYGIDKLDKFVNSTLNISINGQKSTDTIEKMVISSAFVLENKGNSTNEIAGNEMLLDMIKGRKEYIPIAVCQPNKTNGDTTNIRKLFETHPNQFKGLKFHPTALPLANDSDVIRIYTPYIDFAKEKKLPCFFHCQGGQADAWKIYELAQKAPELPFVLGHSGAVDAEGRVNRENAIKVFEDSLKTKKANIYMDLSWVDWDNQGFPSKEQPDVKRILTVARQNNGLDKIVFGTDAPLGCFGEWESKDFNNKTCYEDAVSRFKTTIKNMFGNKSEKVIDKIFYSNAKKLYSIKEVSGKLKFAKGGSAAVGLAAFCALGTALLNRNSDTTGIDHKLRNKIKHNKR